jgi:outer membrane receptor protein involved in Fe transport
MPVPRPGVRAAALVLLALLLSAAGPTAQSLTSLTGRVLDSSGSALPGATVTLAGAGVNSNRRTVVTDQGGHFKWADLAPGLYDLTVELPGFKPLSRQGVSVAAGSTVVDLFLDLAGIAESVVVRGERAARSLKDTAASVAVFDQAQLEQRPMRLGTDELLAQIPNVTSSGTSNFAPTVRGADGTGPAQGADAFFAGTRPRLNIQIDGRPASYNEVVFGDVGLWDVQQVEMFRGAQSTLQGRNAVAGTLVVKTNDPSNHPEAKLRVTAGNLGTRQVAGMVSGPLVDDKISARFSFDRNTSESFVKGFTAFRDVDDPGAFESLTLRGKVLFEPDAAKRFSTLLTISHAVVAGPQTEGVLRPFGEHESSYPNMPVFEPTTTSTTVESRWSLNNYLGYEHTFALTDLKVERKAIPGDGDATINGREFVFEPRLRFSTPGMRLQGFGGVYLFRGRQDEAIDLFGGGTFNDRTDTVAAFGEATVAMPHRLDLTLGGRVEREHRRRLGSDGPFAIDFDETYHVFSPKVGVRWRANDTLTIGTVVSRSYNGGGAGFTYDFPFVSYVFTPEFVVSSETYGRVDLRDGTVSLTGNLFFSHYRDMQLPFDLNPDPNIWSFVVRNADAAFTYGGEFGAAWRPAPGLELFGNLGLLHTEITRYPGSSVEGHNLAQAPTVTSDLGILYHRRRIDFSVDARLRCLLFERHQRAGRKDQLLRPAECPGRLHHRRHADFRLRQQPARFCRADAARAWRVVSRGCGDGAAAAACRPRVDVGILR